MSPISQCQPPSLERLPQVKARTGLSRSEIYRKVALGDFPSPIKLGEPVFKQRL